MQIKTDLKELCPPLTLEEYAALEQSIVAEGCRDRISLWNNIILDGHNRYEICTKHEIKFETVEISVETIDDAKIWMIKNQFGRRNLTPYQRAELALKLEPLIAAKAKEHEREGIQNSGDLPIRTDKELAGISGLSHDTIYKAKLIQNSADEGLKARVRAGEISIHSAYKDIKQNERVADRDNRRTVALAANHPLGGERFRLICSDLLSADIEAGSLDVIVTDPPYPHDLLKCFSDLSLFASTKLKAGGLCVVMSGNMYIPDVIGRLSEFLTYRWMGAYMTPGPITQVIGAKVNTHWKPLLIFETPGERSWISDDVCTSEAPDKKTHHWGQSESGMEQVIRKFTCENMLVCDPFCGASSTGIACLNTNRLYIGVDIDEKSIAISAERLHANRAA